MTLAGLERVFEKYAWVIFVILAVFELGISITIILVTAVGDPSVLGNLVEPTVLKNTIGMSLDQIKGSSPGVLSYIRYSLMSTGTGVITASIFGLGIAVKPFRKGERWAWYASLMWPITFLAIIASDLSFGFLPPAVAVATPVSIVGLLLPYRKFFPRNDSGRRL